MNATMTIDVNNALPPTFNTLDTRQRTRLIRSTRKLGAVLGTTPQLTERDSPLSPPTKSPSSAFRDRKRRQGSIFELASSSSPFTYDYATSSANSSVSSLALPRGSLDSDESGMSIPSLPIPKSFARHVRGKAKSKGKRPPLPTPLVLRLNAVPLPPHDPRVQPTTPDPAATLKTPGLTAALTTPSAIPLTPQTPTTPTTTETRRRRLAKLKRTLGENVPPELIVPLRSMRTQLSSPVDPPPAPMTTSPPPAPFRQPKPHASLQNTPPVSFIRSADSVTDASSRKRSLSVDLQNGVTSPAFAPKPHPKTPIATHTQRNRSHLRSPSHSPSFPYLRGPSYPVEESRSSRVWVTGAGTWMGEWNRKDIREVQQHLRTLKIR